MNGDNEITSIMMEREDELKAFSKITNSLL